MNIDPIRYAAAMRVVAGYTTEELEAMPYQALKLRNEREALYAEMVSGLDAEVRALKAERDSYKSALEDFLERPSRDLTRLVVALSARPSSERDTPHGAP